MKKDIFFGLITNLIFLFSLIRETSHYILKSKYFGISFEFFNLKIVMRHILNDIAYDTMTLNI